MLLRLAEHATAVGVPLPAEAVDRLRRLVADLRVSPTPGVTGCWDLTPGSTVGLVAVDDDLLIEIRPKLPIDRVLFLLSYGMDVTRWPADQVSFAPDSTLHEAVAAMFCRALEVATARGLLHGYRTFDEVAHTIRGRIRFADQIGRRQGQAPPVELRYEDYTSDIPQNQILKAAVRRLGRLHLRSDRTRCSLRRALHLLTDVSDVAIEPTSWSHHWTRLDVHYRPAVELGLVVLGGRSVELHAGLTAGRSILFDMNQVFERFVHVALREALGASAGTFPRNASGRSLRLDRARRVRLEPDLSWWEVERCLFVGDCKYKRTDSGIKHGDLYQLLAYATATELPVGMLIYAAGEAERVDHDVDLAGKRLLVRTVDLAGKPSEVLGQMEVLAHEIGVLADSVRTSEAGALVS